jgi:ATP-dependent DNA ligase
VRAEAGFIEPMQCKPVTALPSDEKWTFEIKFDGYRCIAVKRGREVTLFSRHEKVLNKRFPGVATALASLEGDFILDGDWLPWIQKADLHFRYCKIVSRRSFRFIFTFSTY